MRITTRLLFLVLGSVLAMASAALVYQAILLPVQQMESESATLSELDRSLSMLRSEAALLASRNIAEQTAVFLEAKEAYLTARSAVDGIVLLPQVNEALALAIGTSVNLKGMADDALAQIEGRIDEIKTNFMEFGIPETGWLMVSLLNPSDFFSAEGDQADILKSNGGGLVNTINSVDEIFKIQQTAMKEQRAIVSEEVGKVKVQSLWYALGLILVIVVVFLVLAGGVARGISKALKKIEESMTVITSGDFTATFDDHGRDEIAHLGRQMNGLLDNLNRSMAMIKSDSQKSTDLRNELFRNVSASTSSSVEIEANAKSIRQQMETLDRMITNSSSSVGSMAQTMDRLHTKIEEQNLHVDQSATAVNEMLASIANVARIVDIDRTLAAALVAKADEGRVVFEDSFDKVSEITPSIQEIQSMAEIIAQIAGQTSILAMNAAIEAAHAGEYGKGFAVVADEISKLATASSSSSDEIAQIIKAVTRKIEQATATRGATTGALDAITGQIQEVTRSIEEIYGNMNEFETGSRQILDSMSILRETSQSVGGESSALRSAAQEVGQTYQALGRVSTEVVSNISEITLGLADISRSVRSISQNADEIGQVGASLEETVAQFKTREVDQPEAADVSEPTLT